MNYSVANLGRARGPQTTHMSPESDLDFDLFDLGMVIYQGSSKSLVLSLSGLGLFVSPRFRGVEVEVLEDL
jgi:hypothetical protein